MPRPGSELVTLTLVLFHETHSAYLVGDTGERDKAVWLPMSQVEIDEHKIGDELEMIEGLSIPGRTRPIHNFLVPEWLANERGLL